MRGWRFPAGHDLSVPQMRESGLYVSNPHSAPETDRPFARPDLAAIARAAKRIQEMNDPGRGAMD
jgi:hypothetical protein